MGLIVKDDSADASREKPDPDKFRFWTREDVGKWIGTHRGIAGTHFETSENIATLLDNFEVGIAVVGRELNIDFDEMFREWRESNMNNKEAQNRLIQSIEKTFKNQKNAESAYGFMDAVGLYQYVALSRKAIADDETEYAAWFSALAAEAATRLKGRTAERMLMSGYKHSVVAPAKKTEWHSDMIKAAKRALKNDIPERKLVGLMYEQFPSHSKDAIRRALKKHKVLK